MAKVLLIGKQNLIFKDVYDHLEKLGDFSLQICPEQMDVVQYMVKITEPDVVVISLIGFDEDNNDVLSYFRFKQPHMKALCLGNSFETDAFKSHLSSNYFDVITRPFNNNEILDKIDELIEIYEEELMEREAQEQERRLKLMSATEKKAEVPCGDVVLTDDEEETQEEVGTLVQARTKNASETTRHRIMLIDDNAVQLRALRSNLVKDYDVQVATTGGEALKVMEKNVPDVVFLDYEMPGLDGKSVLKIMREHSVLKNVPVVFLTGEKDKEKIMEVFKLNPDGYMLKPANIDKIHQKINELLGE